MVDLLKAFGLHVLSRWEEGHIEEWSQISFPDGIVEWAESEFRRVKAKQVLASLPGTFSRSYLLPDLIGRFHLLPTRHYQSTPDVTYGPFILHPVMRAPCNMSAMQG